MSPKALAEASEEELIQLAQERDQSAFEELVRRNASASYRLALSVLKDRQDAEDEVQTSMLKAWLHLPEFHGQSRFSTWFRTIVTNQSLMRLRKARRARFESIDESPDEGPRWELPSSGLSPEGTLAREEMIDRVKSEVQRLPPLFREVLVLRDLEQRAIEDVAAKLEITIPAAKSRLSRARDMLRQRMEPFVTRTSGTPV